MVTRASALRFGGALLGYLLIAPDSDATPVGARNDASGGPALSQTFLSAETSYIRTPDGDACLASAVIPIADSRYVEPDGRAAAFETVTRSRAASVQYVVPLGEGAALPFFRVQFKYPLRPDRPMTLDAEGWRVDLAPGLEPSGDSVRIDAPEDVARIRAALAKGAGVSLTATSSDTDRRIEDRLPGMAFRTVDLCAARAAMLAPQMAEPNASPGLTAVVDPLGVTRVDPATARACQMGETEGPIHRGLIRETRGFFAQTRSVYAVFGDDGEIAHLYVPGIFEARHDGAGLYAADISIAANGNAPVPPNRVSGCLGSAPTTLCGYPARDGAHMLGPCLGALLDPDPFEEAVFAIADSEALEQIGGLTPSAASGFGDATETPQPSPGASRDSLAPAGGFSAVSSGPASRRSGAFFDDRSGGSPRPGSPEDPGLSVIPAPPAAWLLVSGLAAAWIWGRSGFA